MILVDDSNWSQSFLSVWWSAYDRKRLSDQAVFTELWLLDTLFVKEKIHLLAPSEMSSIFDAWNQQVNYF